MMTKRGIVPLLIIARLVPVLHVWLNNLFLILVEAVEYDHEHEHEDEQDQQSLQICSFWNDLTCARDVLIAQCLQAETHEPLDLVLTLRDSKPGQLHGGLAWPAAKLCCSLAPTT